MIQLSDIKQNPNNPRIIKDAKFKQLVKSIQDFPKMMALRPMVVDNAGTVLGGNMRLKALQELKFTEVPEDWVKKAEDLSPEEIKRFIVVDNIGFGEHDWEALANGWDLEELQEWGLDIPDFINRQQAVEDDYEMPDEITTEIIPGDLFEIGNHRLLCGDSTKPEDAQRLMNGNKADMIFIDPPYAVKYGKDQAELQAKSGGKFSKTRKISKINGDMLTTEQCAERIWKPAFKNLYDFANDHCSFYMTMCQGGDQMMMMMMMMMMSENWQIKHELIWVKNSQVFSMGRLDYDYKHEPILYGWKKKHLFYAKGEFLNSVWEIPKSNKSTEHPTMKPVALVGNALLNSSKEDDIVVDFFEGSGTSMIACHQLKRIHYGIEFAPEYCQVIVDRMLKLDPSLEINKNGQKYEPKQAT